jgi:hypothetical protein
MFFRRYFALSLIVVFAIGLALFIAVSLAFAGDASGFVGTDDEVSSQTQRLPRALIESPRVPGALIQVADASAAVPPVADDELATGSSKPPAGTPSSTVTTPAASIAPVQNTDGSWNFVPLANGLQAKLDPSAKRRRRSPSTRPRRLIPPVCRRSQAGYGLSRWASSPGSRRIGASSARIVLSIAFAWGAALVKGKFDRAADADRIEAQAARRRRRGQGEGERDAGRARALKADVKKTDAARPRSTSS